MRGVIPCNPCKPVACFQDFFFQTLAQLTPLPLRYVDYRAYTDFTPVYRAILCMYRSIAPVGNPVEGQNFFLTAFDFLIVYQPTTSGSRTFVALPRRDRDRDTPSHSQRRLLHATVLSDFSDDEGGPSCCADKNLHPLLGGSMMENPPNPAVTRQPLQILDTPRYQSPRTCRRQRYWRR